MNESGGGNFPAFDATKKPVQPMGLHGYKRPRGVKGAAQPFGVGVSPTGRLMLDVAQQPIEILAGPALFTNADALLFQAPGPCTDVYVWINNVTAAGPPGTEVLVTLNLTISGAAAASSNQILSSFLLSPQSYYTTPLFGMGFKDMLRGLTGSNTQATYTVFGRKVFL